MRRIVVLLMVLVPLLAMGQELQSSAKPSWVNGYFKELQNSYIEVVSAFGYDLESARGKAAKEIIKRRSLATGSEANVTITNNEISSLSSDHNIIVKARVIDEYVHHTSQGYDVFLLVQTAKNPTYTYESVEVSADYPFSLGALVPGMMQIKKGQKTKGLSIIAAEAAAVAGIIVCENQRSAYIKKSVEQPKFVREYSDKAKSWKTGRNICIGAAAGVWMYNIIDAAVAKGAKRVVVRRADGGGLSMMPFGTPEGAGVAFAYTF